MTKHEIPTNYDWKYPLNYKIWDDEKHYQATLVPMDDFHPEQPVTIIGEQEVICNAYGYDIPDGFLLYTNGDGRIHSVHKSWFKGST